MNAEERPQPALPKIPPLDEWTLKVIAEFERRIGELRKQLECANRDWAEDDTAIRAMLAPILGQARVDGDSHGVPGLTELVEEAAAKLKSAADRLANHLEKALYNPLAGAPIFDWAEAKAELISYRGMG